MIRHNITRDDAWFTGELKTLQYEILQSDEQTPLNCSGLTFSFILKTSETDPDASALLHKTSEITVTGVYNADRSLNTQRVEVPILASDTRSISGWTLLNNLVYWQELKRTDLDTVLSKGTAYLQQSLHLS